MSPDRRPPVQESSLAGRQLPLDRPGDNVPGRKIASGDHTAVMKGVDRRLSIENRSLAAKRLCRQAARDRGQCRSQSDETEQIPDRESQPPAAMPPRARPALRELAADWSSPRRGPPSRLWREWSRAREPRRVHRAVSASTPITRPSSERSSTRPSPTLCRMVIARLAGSHGRDHRLHNRPPGAVAAHPGDAWRANAPASRPWMNRPSLSRSKGAPRSANRVTACGPLGQPRERPLITGSTKTGPGGDGVGRVQCRRIVRRQGDSHAAP